MAFSEASFTSSRGRSLYYREYTPAGRPKAFLIWHHGYGAHSGLADRAFCRIKDSGIGIFAFDADSFGRSCENQKFRSIVTSKEHLPADVFAFVDEVIAKRQQTPKIPLFMGGHSMGGMTALLAGIKRPDLWQGVVTTSPAVDVEKDLPTKVLQFLSPVLLKICPNARLIPAIDIALNSPLPEVVEQLRTDPLVDLGNIRVCMGVTFLESWKEIAAREKELNLPMYIAFSAADKVVYAPAIERLLGHVQSKDVKVNRHQHAMHDLLLGPEEPEISQDIISWILAHA